MHDDIQKMMRQLRLSGMAKRWQDVPFDTPAQYVAGLLQLEMREREANRANRLTRAAGFPSVKTLSEFTWHDGIALPRGLSRQNLEELAFISTRDNLLFLGSVGTGKSHLATALEIKACLEGVEVRFFTAAGLANVLLEKHDRGQLNAFMKKLQRAELIILDEVGYIPLRRNSAELLFQVVAECYERKSMIVTSNLEFSRWNTVLGDTQLTEALVDRLIHHAHIVLFSGDSYRLTQSLARQTAPDDAVTD